MKFAATQAAIDLKRNVEPLKAIANWTLRRRRYRAPTPEEAAKVGADVRVVRDEGLIFVNTGAEIHAYTLAELGM